jgi:hypothetical protein
MAMTPFNATCGTAERALAMKHTLAMIVWILDPFGWLASLVIRGADGLSKDYRNDPVYKKNVQELIERNRRFTEDKA